MVSRHEEVIHLLMDKDSRPRANEVQVLQPTSLPPGTEAKVCSKLVSEPSRPVWLMGNGVCGETGEAVTAAVCQHGYDWWVLMHYSNVSTQQKKMRARSIMQIFSQLEEEQIRESNNVGQYVCFRGSHDRGECLEHIVTLLTQDLKVYKAPGPCTF